MINHLVIKFICIWKISKLNQIVFSKPDTISNVKEKPDGRVKMSKNSGVSRVNVIPMDRKQRQPAEQYAGFIMRAIRARLLTVAYE